MFTKLSRAGLAVATAVALGSTALAVPAEAKGHDDRAQVRGHCSKQGTWKLKAKHDDGRIEIEAEVDTNRVGQVWRVKFYDNGTKVWSGKRTTKAPSGSFSVSKKTRNRAGTDVVKFRATRGSNVCSGSVRV
ncbi:MAG: hypothetical protein QOF52_659 [Propionibacteriaceae bacterium]|jgi:hypothetical protein|nr:hypothetical protein [Propionibacteriaceae bacterium]MDX6320801.1 hypothetical protein [Propionibacteriaceae bacterium]